MQHDCLITETEIKFYFKEKSQITFLCELSETWKEHEESQLNE